MISPPYWSDDAVTVYHGNCLHVLAGLPDATVDAVVTDPPYSIGFMGRVWDAHETPSGYQSWCELWAVECLRVLKPGGHLLAFGGARTWHRLACAIEDAGFEVRDSIAWLYGQGFPKSLDVGKAIDKAAGVTREVIGNTAEASGRTVGLGASVGGYEGGPITSGHCRDITAPATPAAERWQGWGTALKPAFEPIVVARKPPAGTVAGNVLAYGTGALNIDGCRVGTDSTRRPLGKPLNGGAYGTDRNGRESLPTVGGSDSGRWPTNVVLDGSQAAELDRQAPDAGAAAPASGPTLTGPTGATAAYGARGGLDRPPSFHADAGGASRFFPTFRYEPKAPTAERPRVDGEAHATVKPLDLMRWLVRLVTPPGGVVLDPFAGSGTTAEACVIEGARCVTIEREAAYLPLIVARLSKPIQPDLFGLVEPDAPVPVWPEGNGRDGEASADRRYGAGGNDGFAVRPGRRYPGRPAPLLPPAQGEGLW